MKKKAAIFDHDGTLSDPSPRLHFLEGSDKDWASFFDSASQDEPNHAVLKELEAHRAAGHAVVVMTGLPETYMEQRLGWYKRHGVKVDRILMRPEKNFEKAFNLKARWLHELQDEYEFVAAYDDEPGNLDAFKSAGIPCFLVKDGKPQFQHGKAPKAGKGVGRKPRDPSAVVSVRWPKSYIEANNITSRWVKFLVEKEVKRLQQADDAALKCAHNTGRFHREIGLCSMDGYVAIIPGTCPCGDFEPSESS